MATCNPSNLVAEAKCFSCLSKQQLQAVIAQLLCNINDGGGGGTGSGLTSGMIIMWSGTIATIPSGFALCNGASGTPDLKNRFVVCADADNGGAAKSTITGLPLQAGGLNTHAHTMNFASGQPSSIIAVDNTGLGSVIDVGDEVHTHLINGSTAAGTAIPTFYALAYIMKL